MTQISLSYNILNMDTEYYRNYITIIECGSLSAAAKKLSLAQPALSNQLKILTKHYGTPLLRIKRGSHSFTLTEAGQLLFDKARFIVSVEENVKKEIADTSAGLTGTVRISLAPSTSISFINACLSKFAKANPGVTYELFEVSPDEQKEQLLSGVTEIGITNVPIEESYLFESTFRSRQHLVALFHKDSPYLTKAKTLRIQDLKNIPLCLSRGCVHLFKSACEEYQFQPQILSITTTKLSATAWAEQNVGVTIVPTDELEHFSHNLIIKPLSNKYLYLSKRTFYVKDRPLSAVAKALLDYLDKNCIYCKDKEKCNR